MSRVRLPVPSARVYYIVALLVTLVAWPGRDAAALDASLTVEPTMTRGAPDAPVTIVEFSDYQ